MPSAPFPLPDDHKQSAAPSHAPYESYVEHLLAVLGRHPERPAVATQDGTSVLAGRLRDSILQVAAGLTALGIRRGQTVTLLTGNRPEALAVRYAANLLGARVVFLSHGQATAVHAAILDSTGTALLVLDPELRTAAAALLRTTGVPLVRTLGPTGDNEDAFGGNLMKDAAHHRPRPLRGRAHPKDDWCIRHTGGTTGIPKGIRMAHGPYRDLLIRSAAALSPDERPRLLACTPLAHMAGILTDIALLAGGSVVMHDSFDPARVLAALSEERITDLWLLPALLYDLLDHPHLAETDTSTLRRIVYGGTPVASSRLAQAQAAFGPVLHGSYGQTEAGCITELLPGEHGRVRDAAEAAPHGSSRVSVGRPAAGVRIEIRDPAGHVLPTGATGEIHVRTPMMMSGYWRRPELTAEVLNDGWIRTGDIGHQDAEDYLYLVGRVQETVIVVGGHIYPADVEDVLFTHPGIAQCAVFGVPDGQGTEQLHVAVVPASAGQPVSLPHDVREFIIQRRGAMYTPTAVHLVDHIPLTGVGKPDKNRLREVLGLTGEAAGSGVRGTGVTSP
ncbi:fatty acid--CoA ligase [Streptomyces dangxiongensis]|uniref:Fatty acid--CoA ligase n=1 Tax=Streptomyces dangxiongensis TaxID=1442032 RepID=A0A3G2JLI7_9ACTN|nr:AMP-binding protein [Streptomyces dangxiongensis]AYN43204.1 fatty acid--CoA ligase [Streptomyces dangxiongensis]